MGKTDRLDRDYTGPEVAVCCLGFDPTDPIRPSQACFVVCALDRPFLMESTTYAQEVSNLCDIDGDGVNDVEVEYGYPSAHRTNGIPKIMGGNFDSGWTWSGNAANTVFFLTT
jgi:hypothetical protein